MEHSAPASQRSRRRRKARAAAVALFAVGAVSTAVGVADANSTVGANSTTGCSGLNIMETSNSTLSYDKVGLTSDMDNAVDYIMTNSVGPTDINPVNTSSGGPDLQYYDGDYGSFCGKAWHGSGGSVVGTANCEALAGQHCDEHHVYFDNSWTNAQGLSKQRGLACHETGHVFGITHNNHAPARRLLNNPGRNTRDFCWGVEKSVHAGNVGFEC